MALSDKQQAFVEHYLQCWNATEAARRAGYSLRSAYSTGAENLTKKAIREAIDKRLAQMKLTSDGVLAMLSDMASSSMDDFLEVTAEGREDLSLFKAKEAHKLHLVKKVKRTKRTFGEVTEESIEIELYDRQAALMAMGRYHKLFTDRLEVVDWRKEVEALGLNPDEVESEAVNQWVKHLGRGAERADAGDAGEGETAGDGATAE